MSLIFVFLLILLELFITTYIGFFLWEYIKIVKYIPNLLGFIATILIFIIKRNTYGWEGLGFSALQVA
ncbi:hypothetical protein COL91_09560 [Bacillus pseudomycoides]|nr:hypothetical protein COO02_09605 [Bacillus pseudomycoides]PEI91871.1 hypothetical protein CN679_12095 [Bacillus pseudomycoides]PGA91889.1 hypothetical protein COL91_09560 [Bacillus pseudomycoides]PHF50360.1 hypothetical protein COF72_04300 [Bacillus pseudomycoides]